MRAKPVTEFKRRKRRPKVKFKVEDINYKNVELLKNFMNDKGKISPARVRWVIYVIRVFRRQYRSLRCSISANFSRHAEELLSTFATMAAARSAIAKILPLFLCEKRPSQATFATRRGGGIAIFRNSPKYILLKTLASIGASVVWSSLPIAVVTALPTTSSVVSKMHLMLPLSAVLPVAAAVSPHQTSCQTGGWCVSRRYRFSTSTADR